MSAFLSVLVIAVCALLVLVILVQNSKGGGLASNFASSNQVMGVRKTADFLEKATWGLAIALLLLSLLSTPRQQTIATPDAGGSESVTRKKAESVALPAPTAAPAQNAPANNTTPSNNQPTTPTQENK
jgi:preprotein translocase subunit SecG